MHNSETAVTRLGFDLRGLMALTSVAAFISLASKVDLGSAITLAAVFSACGVMAHYHPVGSVRRHRKMASMFLIGLVIAFCSYGVQYVIFGFRVYVMLGTALATCAGVAMAAAALCKPAWLRWSRLALLATALLLVGYLTVHSLIYRHSIQLSLKHQAYFSPRYKFTQGSQYYVQNWFLNRLRLAFGLTDMSHVLIQQSITASDFRALCDVGSVSTIQFQGCTIDLPPELMQATRSLLATKSDCVMFRDCRLCSNSLGALIAATNAPFVYVESCEVQSFKGFTKSPALKSIHLRKTGITDEYIDEVVKLPGLRGSIEGTTLTQEQRTRIKAESLIERR